MLDILLVECHQITVFYFPSQHNCYHNKEKFYSVFARIDSITVCKVLLWLKGDQQCYQLPITLRGWRWRKLGSRSSFISYTWPVQRQGRWRVCGLVYSLYIIINVISRNFCIDCCLSKEGHDQGKFTPQQCGDCVYLLILLRIEIVLVWLVIGLQTKICHSCPPCQYVDAFPVYK